MEVWILYPDLVFDIFTWAIAALSFRMRGSFPVHEIEKVQRIRREKSYPTRRNPIIKRTWLGINKSLTVAESKSTAWKPGTQTWVSRYKFSSLVSLRFHTRVRIWLGLDWGEEFTQMLLLQSLSKKKDFCCSSQHSRRLFIALYLLARVESREIRTPPQSFLFARFFIALRWQLERLWTVWHSRLKLR